ncbi:MAG: ABC transporter substrate-binding protein [Bacteroidota bacterium]
MKKIRIGGVPEHYNLPIHLAKEKGWFASKGIDLEWKDFPGGSGDMKEALRNSEMDVCILLTEGIITDIIKGNPSKIISGYVKTSLTWGIHASANNSLTPNDDDFFTKKIAISRLGSGSHLMPIVNAMMKDRSIESKQLVEVNDIHGGIASLKQNETDLFYWEKFTTKPYVEKGELRKVGEFISPWPCFMIAATHRIITNEPELLHELLQVIYRANIDFMNSEHAPELAAKKYKLSTKDANRWFHATEWYTNGWVSNKMLDGVVFSLKEAGIIDHRVSSEDLIWERNNK